ncbi:uncharacterized protein [Temnothorax nylanderi]|uniref:uncharacterized protein n=1 Tax=Temnothorax nylanderi TaxID=102681 RepID=UPI003A8C21AC
MPKNAEARRELCIRRIREIHNLSLQAATDTAIRANFLARYPSVAKLAEDFENAYLKIIQETADFEAEDVIRAAFDKMHYAVKSRYHLITGASHGNAQTQPAGHSSAVKLPKIALPQFSGDLSLWPSFIALYNTSIHENRQLSAREKYQYLMASLKGEALNSAKSDSAPVSVTAPPVIPDSANAPQSENKPIVTMASLANRVVLLSTVRAEVIDAYGNALPVRVLLDSARQANFITERCLQRGGFRRTKHSATVFAVNETKAATTKGLTSFVIRARGRHDTRFSIEATVLSRITSPLPNDKVEVRSWNHLKGLPLADPEYCVPGNIDILLGAESCGILTVQSAPLRSFATTLESIERSVSNLWQLDEVPEHAPCSEEDRRCKEIFAKTTYRDHSGRFVVLYPFASDPPTSSTRVLIATISIAVIWEVIRDPFPSDGHIYYLPHHGVYKLDSTTTKLRVVFNASSRCANGLSLNDTLLSGPKLQQDLLAILIRFRAEPVALTADVKQMFRQVWINPEQCDYQRIVWRFSESDPILDYILKTVTFGSTCSPFLAIYCLLQLATLHREEYPLAFAALFEALYVDDVVVSVRTVEQARALRDQLLSLLRSAGFELRKWASSHPAALDGLDPQLCNPSELSFESSEDQSLKVLGLRWYSQSDSFGFQVNQLDRRCTKRTILSEVARIFDPLGLLAPLTFTAKCFIQRLWTLKLEWDDEPPADIRRCWNRFQAEIDALASLRIPRTFDTRNVVRCEIHGFCDASELGYGAVIYLRFVTRDGVVIRLLCAKSKVAPLRPVTIPRLELCAALLLSKLIAYVRQVLQGHLGIDAEYAWSDAQVVLAWIRSSPHRWKTFVRNRVALIQEKVPVSSWGHVDTETNPADHCSRGLYPRDLVANSMWWMGPEWLVRFEPRVEPLPQLGVLPIEEERVTSLVALDTPNAVYSLLNKFSSLDKICRVIAYLLRFVSRFRAKSAHTTLAIDRLEMHAALLVIVKVVQADAFRDEIDRLRIGKGIPKSLFQLAPFLDPSGVLRVGGRLVQSVLPYENKHPALLPNKHRLTELVIEQMHRAHLHPGRRTMQYLLAQRFWILGVHRAVRRVLSQCHKCFRANPRAAQPLMATLPTDRVSQAKPFLITGVDFAGPFSLVTRRARGVSSFKAYVCIFVCFAIKAVHLEVVLSLSTDSFLAALQRFVARRGRCSLLYSDCGTNFVGAARELEGHMSLAAERETIKWTFNPPSAPHFGGLWKSGVKSFKTHLRRVVGVQVLSIEEFTTVLAQIEAVLNSRPLCSVSTDPSDLEVLSPGHFLTMEPLVSVPTHDVTPLQINRLSRWQLIQRIHQDFWKRWHHEYLNTLQQRPKWWNSINQIAVGSLVLIKDANMSPLRWKRGRVEALHPGSDGVLRVATVRVADGSIVRPLVKLCPLPMDTVPPAAHSA